MLLSVVTPAGAAVNLSGATLTWSIKADPLESIPRAKAIASPVGAMARAGLAAFSLPITAFKTVPRGRYTYDIVLVQSGGQRDAVVPLSPIYLEDTDLKF